VEHNANHDGAFLTSQLSDRVLESAHAAMADFYNASHPEEIVFGNNMTTLTLHVSRSISRTWQPGDEIVVSAWTMTPISPPGCWRRKTGAAPCAGWIFILKTERLTLTICAGRWRASRAW